MTKIGKGLKKHKHGHFDWLVALFEKWVQLKKLFSQEMIFQSQTLPTCTGVKGTFISRWVFAFHTFVQIFLTPIILYQQVGFSYSCSPFWFYFFVSRTAIMLFIFSEESRGGSQPGKPGNLEIQIKMFKTVIQLQFSISDVVHGY